MTQNTLISPERAREMIESGAALAVDCRFEIAAPAVAGQDPGRGERDYAEAHVPGAVYAHLDRDLSNLFLRGRGRHPLPTEAAFAQSLSRWGIAPNTFVIAYDDASGAFAARLWWLLRLAGHQNVAVLDGGWALWTKLGFPTNAAIPLRKATRYAVRFNTVEIETTDAVAHMLATRSGELLDARAAPRFRGENETIDTVAGHVPGARNRPYSENLGSNGRFKAPADLRDEFTTLLGVFEPTRVVHMCGSGVTACHNLLAMERAGLSGSRVYAGSWSEWVSDAKHPIALGPA